jgi:hypothetical protein
VRTLRLSLSESSSASRANAVRKGFSPTEPGREEQTGERGTGGSVSHRDSNTAIRILWSPRLPLLQYRPAVSTPSRMWGECRMMKKGTGP